MFCLNVSKSSGEADDEGSPTRVSQVQLRQELKTGIKSSSPDHPAFSLSGGNL